MSRSTSRTRSEIETPNGPIRRPDLDRVDSLRALSVASEPGLNPLEPKWPSGWRPYAALFGGFLLMFNSWGLVNAYGTYASYYKQYLLPGRDLLLFNLVGSTQSFVVLILSAIVGRFLDAGYSRHLIVLGTVLVSLGTFLLSVVNGDGGYEQGNYILIWLTQGLISGLGMACFFVSSSQVVATWFKAKKGFAVGIVASGASIAGLIYPMMTKFLIVAVGFNDAVRYVATVVTLTAFLAIFLARPNPEHIVRKPETWVKVSVWVDKHAFSNASFAWFTAGICFMFFGFYAVFFNLEEWAAAEGLGYKDAIEGVPEIEVTDWEERGRNRGIRTFWLLSIMNASSTLGRLSSAYLCDHFGALNVHCIVTFIAAILVLVGWTLSKTVAAAIVFVVLFGIFSGAVIGLPPASVAYILGPRPEAQAKLGQWTGMMYSSAAVFALTGPVIAGHLITEYGENYLTVQCWSGANLFMAAVCMGIAIFYRRRQSAREWLSEKRRRLSTSVTSSRYNLKKEKSTTASLNENETDKESVDIREKENAGEVQSQHV
ncbi:MFS general substrate transporter [Polychaeton citri CBS 116435]|uniref:MFS general substrate transporter n=1 Tax=Polychaeton citri CBS 116435 TaxID=1314669 RepID=A0A9P4Q3P2_9PEZI|nr:MFS general substrate transporter [Polychaeton citri CBS 116435]